MPFLSIWKIDNTTYEFKICIWFWKNQTLITYSIFLEQPSFTFSLFSFFPGEEYFLHYCHAKSVSLTNFHIVLNLLHQSNWRCFSSTIHSLWFCCFWSSWWCGSRLRSGSYWLNLFLSGLLWTIRNPCRWDTVVNVWWLFAFCEQEEKEE